MVKLEVQSLEFWRPASKEIGQMIFALAEMRMTENHSPQINA